MSDCPRKMSKEEMIVGLKAGRTLMVDRKDAPELKDLLELEAQGLVVSELITFDEQSSALKFKWKKETYKEIYRKIEITFANKVDLPEQAMKDIYEAVSKICDGYTKMNPGRMMWPFGVGFKVTYMPMTREEELAGVPIEFAEDTFAIDCSEREDYKWLCVTCGQEQGKHASCISGGLECEFKAETKQ